MKKLLFILLFGMTLLGTSGCGQQVPAEAEAATLPETTAETTAAPAETAAPETLPPETQPPVPPARLTYLGHASIRIETAEGKIIYIDPYAGAPGSYDLPADLILVTHGHADHNGIGKIKNKNPDCRTITWKDALQAGEYPCFALDFVTVRAVQAGNNRYHDLKSGVGFVLEFADGKTVYFSGDTSTTAQMSEMQTMALDYAFFCCDGVYNMDMAEAAACAEVVGAKHSIPYHMLPSTDGRLFDEARAAAFTAPGALILAPGETMELA